MKKLFIIICILLSISGCTRSDQDTYSPSFKNCSWEYYDTELNENINLYISSSDKFECICDCGKHSSELSKYISYSEANNALILTDINKANATANILYYDKHYLVIGCNNKVFTFKNEDNLPADSYMQSAAEYIENSGAPFLTVLKYNEDKITVAPYNYDADAADGFSSCIYNINTSDNIIFSSVTVTVDNGQESVEYYQLNSEDIEHIGEYYTNGYIIFNDNYEIISIIFYGELHIYG